MCNVERHFHTCVDRRDPTNTSRIVSAFERELMKRLRALQKAIRVYLVEQDTLGLKTNAPFKFTTSEQKVRAFKDWLRRQQGKGLVQVIEGPGMGTRPWSNLYIESAYQRGIAQSITRMKSEGVEVSATWLDTAFNRPIHADRAGLVYTRAFSDLEGISDAIGSRMAGILSQGMIDGRGPLDIARQMSNDIKSFGVARARRIARTEVINAHAEATLNTYEEAGMAGVQVMSEFATAGDNKVCSKCAALEGNTYTIKQAHGIIPLHPNCRCAWLPVVGDAPGPIRLG